MDTPTPDTGGNPRPPTTPTAPESHCDRVRAVAATLTAKGHPFDLIAQLMLDATGCN